MSDEGAAESLQRSSLAKRDSPPDSRPSFPVVQAAFAIVAGLYGSLHCLWGHPGRGIAGLGLSVLALYWPRSLWDDDEPARWSPARRRLALLLVVSALIFFRCYRLLPPGLWGDDAINGLLAFDVIDGNVTSPFQLVQHAHSFFHALTSYAIAVSFYAFGPGLEALRAPGIVAGIVAGVCFYAALLPTFGARVALVAGLFFAASPLQITHAKNLIQAVFGLAFQCAGVAFLVGAFSTKRRAFALASACAFAATIYTYHAAKIAPLVALPFLLSWRSRATPSRDDRRTLWMALALFALCLVPAAFSYAGDPGKLTRRFAGTSLLTELSGAGSLRPLWESIWRTLAIFHYQQGPPRYHWFGPGDEAALNPFVAFLALHGFLVSARNWRQPRHALLLGWFAVGLIPGLLSAEAPRGYRVLLATPPLFAWAALPIVALWRHQGAARIGTALRTLAAALVIAALFVDFNYYFYRTYTRPEFRWMQGERQVAMARALHRRGPGWRGYLLTPIFTTEYETIRFLARAWNLQLVDVSNLVDIMPPADPPEAGALFITTPGTHEAGEVLRAFYPNATQESVFDPQPRAWFFGGLWPYHNSEAHREAVATFLFVGRADLERAARQRGPRWRPFIAAYQPKGGKRLTRREPLPFFNFFPDNFGRRFDAQWWGSLHVPPPGGYTIEVRGEGMVETRVDGAAVPREFTLATGLHRIEVHMPEVDRRLRLSLWWTPPQGTRTLIPPQAWRPVRSSDVPQR